MTQIYNQIVDGAFLRQVREELGESLSEFGMTLKRAAYPDSYVAWSKQYIYRLENDQDRITDQIAYGAMSLAAELDGQCRLKAAIPTTVYAAPGQIPEHTHILPNAKVIKCYRPACPIRFIQTHPRQKYHTGECRKLHYKEIRVREGD